MRLHDARLHSVAACVLLVFLAVICFDASGATAQTPGLVAAYAFNEASGSTVTDVSGNNNTGSLGAGVTRTTQGRFGSALVFNGASFVTVPHAASLSLTTAMTLEAWVFPTVTPATWSTVLMKEQPGEFVYALASTSTRAPPLAPNAASPAPRPCPSIPGLTWPAPTTAPPCASTSTAPSSSARP